MEETGATTQSPYADDLFCPECGYSLRGLTSDRCPECGLSLDFIESAKPLIPWEQRRELGRLRAYWQTVLLVMFRTKLFCRAAYRPVSYRDAQLFRWVTILHVYVPMLLALAAVHFLYPDLLPWAADNTGWWFIALACGCVLLALAALTGLPSYFFHPRHLTVEQQNRAIALSYYGCAPLAWTAAVPVTALFAALAPDNRRSELDLLIALLVVGLLGAVIVLWIGLLAIARGIARRPILGLAFAPLLLASVCTVLLVSTSYRDLDLLLGLLAVSAGLAVLLFYWFGLIRIARHTLRRSLGVFRVALLVPLSWGLVGLLVLVGLPLVAYCVALVFHSLRSGGLGG